MGIHYFFLCFHPLGFIDQSNTWGMPRGEGRDASLEKIKIREIANFTFLP